MELCSPGPEPNGWIASTSASGDPAATVTLAGPIAPGASATIDIELCIKTVLPDPPPTTIINFTEITEAEDENGNNVPDVDSTPDNMNGDPPAEDDHDDEPIPLTPLATISGNVSEDTDAGTPTPDVPIEGVIIELYIDANGDGIPDPSELVASQPTNMGGNYHFNNLVPGLDYIVVEQQPTPLTDVSEGDMLGDDPPDNPNETPIDNIIVISDLMPGEDDLGK